MNCLKFSPRAFLMLVSEAVGAFAKRALLSAYFECFACVDCIGSTQ